MFKQLFFLLTQSERKHALFLLIMIITTAFIDMIGVASILPFVSVLTNSSLIETNFFLKKIFEASSILGVQNIQQFLYLTGLVLFIFLIFSLIFKAITNYLQIRFIQMQQYSLSKRLMEVYLGQSYSWFLDKNSDDLGKNILSEVGVVIGKGLSPLIELIAKGVVTIFLITLLFVADPQLAIIIGTFITLSYMLIFYAINNYLKIIGLKRVTNNHLRFITIGEAFSAIKAIKVGGFEEVYIKLFSKSAKKYAKTQAHASAISDLPRFLLEAIAFGGILLIILYLLKQTGKFNDTIPLVSLYAFAGYRLMPAIQQIYASLTHLTFVSPALKKLYYEFKKMKKNKKKKKKTIKFDNSIFLNKINYSYPGSSKFALKNINLKIPNKSIIGLIGTTGSGKTTLVDIILGLLLPQQGKIKIDGKTLTPKNLRSWQDLIGYVPQNIYLSDDSVQSNIAFGQDANEIDKELLQEASQIACLDDFIKNELTNKYQTNIGENGIKLSGGQRQRIGIARALYRKPKILILDEATNALDSVTEKKIMDSLNRIRKDITIVIIAHRLNTLKNCDIIYKLNKGKVIQQGTYKKIIGTNKIVN